VTSRLELALLSDATVQLNTGVTPAAESGRESYIVRHRGRSRVAVLAVALVLTLLTAAGGLVAWQKLNGPLPAASSPLVVPDITIASPRAGLSGPPTEVRIPSIGVSSSLEKLTLDSTGAMRAPRDYASAGWFAGGVAPGDAGPAVIAGHVDSYRGPAIFYRLHQLRPGDLVQVQRSGQWLSFQVVSVEQYAKDKFPSAKVYRPTPGPELRLITCGGGFDSAKRSYQDNMVVYAIEGKG
jgi:LPXTG-site transpeptidase (sortase) family protein